MGKIRPTACGKYFLKVFLLVIISITAISLFYFINNFDKTNVDKHKRKIINNPVSDIYRPGTSFNGEKIVHLDLKGAPPKISYFKQLFPLLRKMGATGVLIEYEDMFPYSGALLQNVSAFNAYSLEEIELINEHAQGSQLKVIPLVQTFGHMEFLLKLLQFKDYREVELYPNVICPSHSEVLYLIEDMVEQVIKAHPDSNMIHIGSDEVYYLGMCEKCKEIMNNNRYSKNMLFIDHVNAVASLIHSQFPDLRILMWDDQFHSITLQEFQQMPLHSFIEPVVWKYQKDVTVELGPSLWDLYEKMFPQVWIASAFKGATGSNQYVVDVNHYLQNHRSWMHLYNNYRNRIQFKGIIITGWQRYDHFASLCELLPAGIPSLAMSFRIIMGYKDSPFTPSNVSSLLGCENPYALMSSAFGTPHCSFPGGLVLENVLRLEVLKQEFDTISKSSVNLGWMHKYNIEHAFSSPQLVKMATDSLNRIKYDLASIDNDMTSAMQEVYDNYTIDEWKETYLKPFEDKVNKMWMAREIILNKGSWPRRPLSFREL